MKILNKLKDVLDGNTLLPPSTADSKMLTQTNSEKVLPTLVWVDGHVLTSHFDMAGDNWTKRMVPWTRFPKLGRLVKGVFIIEKAI